MDELTDGAPDPSLRTTIELSVDIEVYETDTPGEVLLKVNTLPMEQGDLTDSEAFRLCDVIDTAVYGGFAGILEREDPLADFTASQMEKIRALQTEYPESKTPGEAMWAKYPDCLTAGEAVQIFLEHNP